MTPHEKPVEITSSVSGKKECNGFGLAKGTIEINSDIVEPVLEPSDWDVLG